MTTRTDPDLQSPLADVLRDLLRTKTACDVEGTMAFFAPDMVAYMDATLGWDFDSHASLTAVFTEYMPTWSPPARSYATRILAGETSALVQMVDTPELFGGELRILAAVDFVDGGVVRWIDYWDSALYDPNPLRAVSRARRQLPARSQRRAGPDPRRPRTGRRGHDAAARVRRGRRGGGGRVAAPRRGARRHGDATQVIGRIEATRYLQRTLDRAPHGRGSRLRHVVGGERGGGFEWTSRHDAGDLVGITALELDAGGLITAITSVYDSTQVDAADRRALRDAAIA